MIALLESFHFNYYSLPPLISASIFAFLGLFIYFKNSKADVNRVFGYLCFSTFWWQFSWFVLFNFQNNELIASIMVKVGYIGISFIGVTMLHFVVVMFDWKNLLKYIYLSYGFGFLLVLFLLFTNYYINGFYCYNFGYYPKAGFLHPLHLFHQMILGAVCVAILCWLSIRKYRNNPVKSLQAKYIMAALVVYTPAGLDYLTNYGLPVYPSGYIFILITASIIAYTIIRYRAFEIDTVIHKTALWLFTSGLILLPLIIMMYLMKDIINQFRWGHMVLLVIVLVYLFGSYYRVIQPKIDHLFRRRKYDYYQVLGELGPKVGSELDLQSVINRIFKELKEILYISNGILLVVESGKEYFEEKGSIGYNHVLGMEEKTKTKLLFESKIIKWIGDKQKALELEQIVIDPHYGSIKEETENWFKQHKIEIVIPLITENKVNGILSIGKKENLQHYTLKDIELLEKLGKQVGVTIDNALHHGDIVEKERLAEEMRLGQEIQMNLLPKAAPEVAGLKVYGLMVPAKEIGGDYYDYIVTRDSHSTTDKVAIVIGDVSGKGVGAGLVMAMAKTAVHAISEEAKSPKEVLVKTNRILHQHINGEKFMTMLYLEWDCQQKKMRYSSAGHEHVIIYRSGKVIEAQQGEPASGIVVKQTKEAFNSTTLPLYHSTTSSIEVIPSGGFMLGMLPEVEDLLEDKELTLQPGDKIVLYTDGVTEAHDCQDDMYALERLTETVRKHGEKSLEELILKIKDDIYAFIGTQSQYDDITLVGLETL